MSKFVVPGTQAHDRGPEWRVDAELLKAVS